MTITATKTELEGPTSDGSSLTTTTFTLSDQGTETTDQVGNTTFNSTKALDAYIEKYVKDRQGIRTKGGYEYPAKVEIHQIKQKVKQ